jgi:hypothetical protein
MGGITGPSFRRPRRQLRVGRTDRVPGWDARRPQGRHAAHGRCARVADCGSGMVTPPVRVLDADIELNAMLLESCDPGYALRQLPEPEQDVVIAGLLRRLWRRPVFRHPFRPLATMTMSWAEETHAAASRWPDAGLVQEGLRLFDELSGASPDDVRLATDLHAGNVLSAAGALARHRSEAVHRRPCLRRDTASPELSGSDACRSTGNDSSSG